MPSEAEKPANVDLSGGPASPERALATSGHFSHYAIEDEDLSDQDSWATSYFWIGLERRSKMLRWILSRCEKQGECLIWKGPTSGNGRGGGYGRFSFEGTTSAVHRVIYEVVYGPIPPRKQVDHKCNNRLCCRPDHLQHMTHKRNQKLRDKRRSEADK